MSSENVRWAVGCDVDISHGAIVLVQFLKTPQRVVISDLALIFQYSKKFDLSIGEKAPLHNAIDLGHFLADEIYRYLRSFPLRRNPPIVIEYDINRVHYAKARKLACVQVGHVIAAMTSALRLNEWSRPTEEAKFVLPRQKHKILKGKATDWMSFGAMTGLGVFDSVELPELDAEGDIADAIAVAYYQSFPELVEKQP